MGIETSSTTHEALYDHFGWRVRGVAPDLQVGRLAETHEYFHRQLDDTTAFGGLISTVAALADAMPEQKWVELRDGLIAQSDLVHETFAVGMSLVVTQRPINRIDGYPAYDRHVQIAQRLLGQDTQPWVTLAALRAAATACMQTRALAVAVETGLASFEPSLVGIMDRPNQRLAALLAGGFADAVQSALIRARADHGREPWWREAGPVLLPPEAMDGAAGEASATVHRCLLDGAEAILRSAGAASVAPDAHHEHLRTLLDQARELAPAGLTRIGALVEGPGGELLHGGPLDGQVIELTAAPRRAVVLPHGAVPGLSGEGSSTHAYVAVTTARRLRSAHDLEGVGLPDTEVVACLRSTILNGDERDSILLVLADRPEQLDATVPVYVSIHSSAAAADPVAAAKWMRWADPDLLSLVMDTPATPALRRWCAGGARFRAETRRVQVADQDVRVIAGRVEEPGRQSAMVIIPTTEFGARWFEAARAEDAVLGAGLIEDVGLFERESRHLDVILTHLLLEERHVGTGSWRS